MFGVCILPGCGVNGIALCSVSQKQVYDMRVTLSGRDPKRRLPIDEGRVHCGAFVKQILNVGQVAFATCGEKRCHFDAFRLHVDVDFSHFQ